MRAELKALVWLSVSPPLHEFQSENITNFGANVRLLVGPEGEDTADSFDLLICTPLWLQDQCRRERYVWGFQTLLVAEYDVPLVERAVTTFLARCSAPTWEEVAHQVRRIGHWEFEDYQP